MTNEQEQLLINQFAIREYQYEITHPKCPVCGYYMNKQTEKYIIYDQYEDEWYECDNCGYCQNN